MNREDLNSKEIQADELEEEILQLQNFKADKPNDLFEFYHPDLRRQYVDSYNVSRCWLESLLFWKRVYPDAAFHFKTAYGRETPIVKSKKVREYLDAYFGSVCQNFQNLNYIEVQLMDKRVPCKVLETYRCHIKILNQGNASSGDKFGQDEKLRFKTKSLNSLQKEISFKKFLSESEQGFKQNLTTITEGQTRFKLGIGYSWKPEYANNSHRSNLLEKWTEKQKRKDAVNELQSSTASLSHSQNIEMMSERIIER